MQQLFAWHYFRTFPKAEIDDHFKPITSNYGVKIIYEIGEDFFSPLENPPIPAGPPRNSKVKPIRHRVLMEYPEILQKAFDKYPGKVIKRHLNSIYFAGEIDDGELKYCGTYDPFRRIIYLVDNDTNNDVQAIHTFHHEFSSLLIRAHSFFINPWTDQHPKNFKYLEDMFNDWGAIRKARKRVSEKYCYERGFVTNYGLTNFNNDFSEYSAMIFTHPQKFQKIMNQYPRVRGKFLVWLEFHQKIDPIFTEKYLFGKSINAAK
jgi:hypothetical protein